MRDDLPAVLSINQKFGQSCQRDRFRLFEKSVNGMLENVFGTWPPIRRPEIAENADNGRDDKRAGVVVDRLENVDPDDSLRVGGVEVNDVVGAVPGNRVQQVFNKRPVW